MIAITKSPLSVYCVCCKIFKRAMRRVELEKSGVFKLPRTPKYDEICRDSLPFFNTLFLYSNFIYFFNYYYAFCHFYLPTIMYKPLEYNYYYYFLLFKTRAANIIK